MPWFSRWIQSEMPVAGITAVSKVPVAAELTCIRRRLLSGQSPPGSPWGPLTWRLLLARASSYPARLPAIQLWMFLSRGHSTASSSTSSETAITSKEWAGWVILSIAYGGLIGTHCVMCKGFLRCPLEVFLDTHNTQAPKRLPKLVPLGVSQWSLADGTSKRWSSPLWIGCGSCATPLKIY